MAKRKYFRRNKLKCRVKFLRKCVSSLLILWITLFLSSIIYEEHSTSLCSHVNLNDTKQNTVSPTQNSKLFNLEVIKYDNKFTALEQIDLNGKLPELKLQFDYTDKKSNKEFSQSFNSGMINETRTKFQHQGSCYPSSPTNHIPSYASKDALVNQIKLSIMISDSNNLKNLKQYTNESETMEKPFEIKKSKSKKIEVNISENVYFYEDFDSHFDNRTENRNDSLSSKFIHISDVNSPNTYRDLFKLEKSKYNQKTQRNKHVENRIVQQMAIEKQLYEQIITIVSDIFNIINAIYKPARTDWEKVIPRDQETYHAYGGYTEHSKIHPIKLKYAKSPGSVIKPSKLVMLISILVMYAGASTSSAGASGGPTAPLILSTDLYKFKVIHTLNTVGQPVLLEVYKMYKQFDDTKNIKDHLIKDLHMSIHSYRDKFDSTMQNVIETTANSGKDYDISLLIKCLRVLSWQYDRHGQNKWRDENELERRCQKLADKRNQVFHTFSGITIPEMSTEIDEIKNILIDILASLELRYSSESSKINDLKTESFNKISYIRTHPLEKSEIRTCLLQKYIKFLRDEIPSYRNKCREWGKLKILDFLLGSKTFHDIKLLFTEVIVEKSNKLTKNTPVNCKDILRLASPSSILLIESEAGGGKTTIFRF
ncbi:unnamed protein product, partial [Meganyctiphanes norvegica]